MSSSFHGRLDFDGDLDTLIDRLATNFQLGQVTQHNVIEVGFEDCNIKFSTQKGDYLVKIFSKQRNKDEIIRSAESIKRVVQAGVNHPRLLLYDGDALYQDKESRLQMVVMEFIQGKTFYDLSSKPDDHDLALIATEAVKINAIDYDPPYLFDSWAIPNMQWIFDKTKDHLSSEGRELVETAFEYYNRIPFDQLPKCFVHGDLIKTNLIKGDDGKIYVIDFSVANTYPRIQELAVMAANLLFDEKSDKNWPLRQRVETVKEAYLAAGGTLTDLEKDNLFNYALPGAAMEYMGSVNERLSGDTSEEILYWEKLGLESLRGALA